MHNVFLILGGAALQPLRKDLASSTNVPHAN